MTRSEIANKIIANWPYGGVPSVAPAGFLEFIESSKTFATKFMDVAYYEFGINAGLAKAIANAIKESEKRDNGSITSLNAAGRVDRHLRENKIRMRRWQPSGRTGLEQREP